MEDRKLVLAIPKVASARSTPTLAVGGVQLGIAFGEPMHKDRPFHRSYIVRAFCLGTFVLFALMSVPRAATQDVRGTPVSVYCEACGEWRPYPHTHSATASVPNSPAPAPVKKVKRGGHLPVIDPRAMAMPGEVEFCRSQVAQIETRKKRLEIALLRINSQLNTTESVYLAEMREMRRTLVIDAFSDALSAIPFDEVFAGLAQSGKISSQAAGELAKSAMAMKSSFSVAVAIDARNDSNRQLDTAIEATNGFSQMVLALSRSVPCEELSNINRLGDFSAALVKGLRHEPDPNGEAGLLAVVTALDDWAAAMGALIRPVGQMRAATQVCLSAVAIYHIGRSADAIEDGCSHMRLASAALQRRINEYDTSAAFYRDRIVSLTQSKSA